MPSINVGFELLYSSESSPVRSGEGAARGPGFLGAGGRVGRAGLGVAWPAPAIRSPLRMLP